MTEFWMYLWNMPILFVLFRISLRWWYGLKAFIEDFKSWFIVELYTEIPLLLSLFKKCLKSVCLFFYDFLLTFNVRGQNFKKASFYTNKSIVFIVISWKNGVLVSLQHPLCRRACINSNKTKIYKNLTFRDIQKA